MADWADPAKGVLLEQDGALARLTLNRPEYGNAIDVPMARALLAAAITCDTDPAIRCVVLSAAGRMFCAGGDVGQLAAAGDALPALLKEITDYLHAAIVRLARLDKPLVTAVHGPAAGAGVGLAALGDIVLAEPSAHFTLAYSAIGLSPDAGATWLLPRLIGMRRAQELCLTNRRVGATEAAEIGLVTRVVAQGTAASEAVALARQLSQSAAGALGRTKHLLLAGLSASLEEQLEAEGLGIAAQGAANESRIGIRAFIERREPVFYADS